MTKKVTVMKEKDGIRGLVPGRDNGAKDKVYAAYLDKLNPRGDEAIQQALAQCPDPRFQQFLDRVMNPRYLRVSLATIAKGCGIDMLEFGNWLKKDGVTVALATAQLASPKVVKDMVVDALSKDDYCDRCDNLGFVTAPPNLPDDVPGYKMIQPPQNGMDAIYIRTCPKCNGEGTVRKSGDTHSRDRILEMAGAIVRGKAGVNIIQNFSGASHSSAVSTLDEMMNIDTVDSDAEEVED